MDSLCSQGSSAKLEGAGLLHGHADFQNDNGNKLPAFRKLFFKKNILPINFK